MKKKREENMDIMLSRFITEIKEQNYEAALYQYFIMNSSILKQIIMFTKANDALQNILMQLIDGDTDSHSIILLFLRILSDNRKKFGAIHQHQHQQ